MAAYLSARMAEPSKGRGENHCAHESALGNTQRVKAARIENLDCTVGKNETNDALARWALLKGVRRIASIVSPLYIALLLS